MCNVLSLQQHGISSREKRVCFEEFAKASVENDDIQRRYADFLVEAGAGRGCRYRGIIPVALIAGSENAFRSIPSKPLDINHRLQRGDLDSLLVGENRHSSLRRILANTIESFLLPLSIFGFCRVQCFTLDGSAFS